jgi:hypothetical protein
MNFIDSLKKKDLQREGTKFAEWVLKGFEIEVNDLI